MANSGIGTIITWGAIGLGAWWVYENWSSITTGAASSGSASLPAGVPATGAANGYRNTGGGTLASPAGNDAWVDASGNVVAVFIQDGSVSRGWVSVVGTQWNAPLATWQSQVASSASLMTGSNTTTGPPIVPQPPAGAPSTKLAAIYLQFLSAVSAAFSGGNPAISQPGGMLTATPDVFNYYLAQVLPSPPSSSPAGWPPDVSQVFPGVDRTQPMGVSTYFQGVSKYLATLGLSGLGNFAPASRQWPEVATEPWNGGNWIQGWWTGGGRAVQ